MKGSLLAVTISIGLVILLLGGCSKSPAIDTQVQEVSKIDIQKLKNWWAGTKTQFNRTTQQMDSRIPDTMTIQNYWRSQFLEGIPKWSSVKSFTNGQETIYEMPFELPDNLIMLNEKPDASPQLYITGKAGSNVAMRPSQTYLVIKEQPGVPIVAEVMWVVLNNSYMEVLDSTGAAYPDVRINHVYPSPNNLDAFSGNVKFYTLDGVQLLEQGFNNGVLNDYIEYADCAFSITPHPNLSTTRMYTVCTYTYIYQQNCGPDAGCTDWELIGINYNGCETIITPDSPPVSLGSGSGGGNGGNANPPPPPIHNVQIRPGARLCGNYKWKNVGEAVYAQIRNLGATAAPRNPGGGIPQTFTLGLTCVYFPKWYVTYGFDITEFVNRAYNKAAERMQNELNTGALPPSAAILHPKFEEYMRFYLKNHPDGSYHANATIIFRNGCDGPIPVSEPKWCFPE